MTKVMLWPDLYREHGHWLPAVNLAKSLQSRNYEVEFMGIPDCEAIVSPYGGVFRPILSELYPVGHTVNDQLEPIGQRWKPHHLMPILRGELDDVMLGSGAPDLLIAGYFVGLEALLVHYKYGVPLVTLTTFLRHPQEDPASFARGKLVFMSDQMRMKLMRDATGDDGITLNGFVQPLRDAHELIPCPRAFDFFDEDWDHEKVRPGLCHYVEPMIPRTSLSGDPAEVPPPLALPEGKRIIFATAGSQVADYEDKAKLFFQALIDMMKTENMHDFHLVLSVGDKLLEFFQIQYGIDKNTNNNALPSNVTLEAWVSQIDILKTADVVFMHGGLATIKESIAEGVPIVIFPHGKDQTENALRLVRNGLGLLPDVDLITPQVLRRLLTEATSNTWMQQKITAMQALFVEEDEQVPPKSIPVIEGVVPP